MINFLLRIVTEAEEKKGYVKPIIILTVLSEIDMWFRMWVQSLF